MDLATLAAPPSLADVEAAARRIDGHALVTPLLRSPTLDALAGRPVLVKAECLQLTGSFKFRGAYSAISALPEDRRRAGVLAFSSGNHAQGVALAARMHGVPAVIVMPHDAPAVKVDGTRALGAEVVPYRRGEELREELGTTLALERGLTLVRPFDDPQVIAGQGTVGLEIAAQAAAMGVEEADVLICCGGGGLTAGVALALEARAPGLRPRTVEPEGFDDVARSLASGRREENARMTGSICDAILTGSPGEMTFPILARLCGPGLAVSDADALRAMAVASRHLRIVLEPGGAVALAAALALPGEGPVIAVASGGQRRSRRARRRAVGSGPGARPERVRGPLSRRRPGRAGTARGRGGPRAAAARSGRSLRRSSPPDLSPSAGPPRRCPSPRPARGASGSAAPSGCGAAALGSGAMGGPIRPDGPGRLERRRPGLGGAPHGPPPARVAPVGTGALRRATRRSTSAAPETVP